MMASMKSHQAEQLPNDLCVDLGFCLPQEARDQLTVSPPTSAKAFVDAVFVAEGLEPSCHQKLWVQVHGRVLKSFDDSIEDS